MLSLVKYIPLCHILERKYPCTVIFWNNTPSKRWRIRHPCAYFLETSTFVFQAPSGPSVALPAGWEERQDANGRTYYVNHIGESL